MTLTQKDIKTGSLAEHIHTFENGVEITWVRTSRIAEELEPLLKLNSRTDIRLDLKAIINTLKGAK